MFKYSRTFCFSKKTETLVDDEFAWVGWARSRVHTLISHPVNFVRNDFDFGVSSVSAMQILKTLKKIQRNFDF